MGFIYITSWVFPPHLPRPARLIGKDYPKTFTEPRYGIFIEQKCRKKRRTGEIKLVSLGLMLALLSNLGMIPAGAALIPAGRGISHEICYLAGIAALGFIPPPDHIGRGLVLSDETSVQESRENFLSENGFAPIANELDLNVLILLDSSDLETTQYIVGLVENMGIQVASVYPPHVLIGHVPDNLFTVLIELNEVTGAYNGVIDPSVVEGLGGYALQAVQAWNDKLEGKFSPLNFRPAPMFLRENLEPTLPSEVYPSNSFTVEFTPPYYSSLYDYFPALSADSRAIQQNGGVYAEAVSIEIALGYKIAQGSASHSIRFTAEGTGVATIAAEIIFGGGAESALGAYADIGCYSYINGEQYQEVRLRETLIPLWNLIPGIGQWIDLIVFTYDHWTLYSSLASYPEKFTHYTHSRTFNVVKGETYIVEAGVFAEATAAILGGSHAAIVGQIYQIKVTAPDTTDPSAPDLLAPTDGAIQNEATFELGWEDVYDWSGIAEYHIEIDNDSNFDQPLYSFTSQDSSIEVTLPDDVYYWRVRAKDGAGNIGGWSETRRFFVRPFQLVYPVDGGFVTTATPTLDWYQPAYVEAPVTLVITGPVSITETELTSTSYKPSEPLPDGAYTWKVGALWSGETWLWSDEWQFVVDTDSSISSVTLEPGWRNSIFLTVTAELYEPVTAINGMQLWWRYSQDNVNWDNWRPLSRTSWSDPPDVGMPELSVGPGEEEEEPSEPDYPRPPEEPEYDLEWPEEEEKRWRRAVENIKDTAPPWEWDFPVLTNLGHPYLDAYYSPTEEGYYEFASLLIDKDGTKELLPSVADVHTAYANGAGTVEEPVIKYVFPEVDRWTMTRPIIVAWDGAPTFSFATDSTPNSQLIPGTLEGDTGGIEHELVEVTSEKIKFYIDAYDAVTGEPLEAKVIVHNGGYAEGYTPEFYTNFWLGPDSFDELGNFIMNYRITVSKLGYYTETMPLSAEKIGDHVYVYLTEDWDVVVEGPIYWVRAKLEPIPPAVQQKMGGAQHATKIDVPATHSGLLNLHFRSLDSAGRGSIPVHIGPFLFARPAELGGSASGTVSTKSVHYGFNVGSPPILPTLELENGDLDLHLYDPEGRHVGWNYGTNELELEIPGAEYSGRDVKPEWIRVPEPQSGFWVVMIYPYEVENAAAYTLEVFADASPPESSVDPISPYWLNADRVPFEVSATASDSALVEGEVPSGVANVELWYRYSPDNSSWDNWTLFGVDNDNSDNWSWEFTAPENDGYYEFYSIAVDRAGNREEVPEAADTRAGVDTSPPESSVTSVEPYWQNASTTPFDVSATASDETSGVASVELFYRYSVDNSSWDRWTSFGTDNASPWSWSFDAPSGDGFYEFYTKAADVAGNAESKQVVRYPEGVSGYLRWENGDSIAGAKWNFGFGNALNVQKSGTTDGSGYYEVPLSEVRGVQGEWSLWFEITSPDGYPVIANIHFEVIPDGYPGVEQPDYGGYYTDGLIGTHLDFAVSTQIQTYWGNVYYPHHPSTLLLALPEIEADARCGVDTVPPEITAAFVPVDVEEDEGLFKIEFAAADNEDGFKGSGVASVEAVLEVPYAGYPVELHVDDEVKYELEDGKLEIKGPDPEALWAELQALGGISVENCQLVKVELENEPGEFEVKYEDGALKVEANSIVLTVRAADVAGNENEISVPPAFSPEEEGEELEESDEQEESSTSIVTYGQTLGFSVPVAEEFDDDSGVGGDEEAGDGQTSGAETSEGVQEVESDDDEDGGEQTSNVGATDNTSTDSSTAGQETTEQTPAAQPENEDVDDAGEESGNGEDGGEGKGGQTTDAWTTNNTSMETDDSDDDGDNEDDEDEPPIGNGQGNAGRNQEQSNNNLNKGR